MGMKLDWVGKYFIGAAALYAVTHNHRQRKQAEAKHADELFLKHFISFPARGCLKFLQSCRWQTTQIPCYFEHIDGTISEFVYEPGAPEKLTQPQLESLTRFIEIYGFNELKPALELSKEGARDEPIVFLWCEKTKASEITQLSRAKHWVNSL